jgi:hypothetical protein
MVKYSSFDKPLCLVRMLILGRTPTTTSLTLVKIVQPLSPWCVSIGGLSLQCIKLTKVPLQCIISLPRVKLRKVAARRIRWRRVELFCYDFVFSAHDKMGVKYLVSSKISQNGRVYSFPIFTYD